MILSTALVTLLGMPTVSMATNTAGNTIDTAIDPEFDASIGWKVDEYTTDLAANIDAVDKVFLQDVIGYIPKAAGTSSFNIGNGSFKATRVFHLKAGKKYNINLLYTLVFISPKTEGQNPGRYTVKDPIVYLDFNGTTITAGPEKLIRVPYNEIVEPTTDMDYVITMGYTVPAESQPAIFVGYDPAAPDAGIHEIVDPKPVPEESASTEPSETTTTDDSSTTSTTTSEDPVTSSTAAENNNAASSSNDPAANGNGAAGTSSSSSSSNYKDPADPADPAKKASLPRTNETNSSTISMIGFGCLAVLAATTYWLKKVKKTGNN